MVDRFYGYQYDTNPKKLTQSTTPFRNKYTENNKADVTKNVSSNNRKNTSSNNRNVSYSKNKDLYNSNNITKNTSSSKLSIQNSNREMYGTKKNDFNSKAVTRRSLYNNGTQNDISHKVNSKINKEHTIVKEQNSVTKRTNKQNIINNNVSYQNNKNVKDDVKPKIKMILCLIAGFSVLFAMSYQNSLISESFNRKEQYRKEMEALSKTNQQIEVGIENSLNLNNIEQSAKDKLGMQKLNNNQKIYISLPKQDYIAPATEEIVMEEEVGFFEKLIKGFTKAIK